jgi:cellobiose-specific phosphotransferase system component IIC
MRDEENSLKTLWKAAPWISKVILLLCTAIFIMISGQPIAHPAATAAAQGIAFTSSLGATVFRVSLGGFPLGCAVFLVYCLTSSRRTLTGLILSALVLGTLLVVRIYGMEVDSSVQQSMPLVKPEIVLVAIVLIGVAIEIGRQRNSS